MLRCKINISAKSHNKKNLMIFIEHCTIKIFYKVAAYLRMHSAKAN